MHIKLNTNGVPETYSIGQLRRDNKQVSFPVEIPEATLAEYNVYPVKPSDAPNCGVNDVVEQAGYLQLADGTWKQAWTVRPMNQQEVDEKAADVRMERNSLLTNSDWTQVADAPLDQAAWAAYRQALRGITSQAGFPFQIEWPVAPGGLTKKN